MVMWKYITWSNNAARCCAFIQFWTTNEWVQILLIVDFSLFLFVILNRRCVSSILYYLLFLSKFFFIAMFSSVYRSSKVPERRRTDWTADRWTGREMVRALPFQGWGNLANCFFEFKVLNYWKFWKTHCSWSLKSTKYSSMSCLFFLTLKCRISNCF